MVVMGGYDLKTVGIEAEATFGTDPLAGLVGWPGLITNMPSITEDYGTAVVRGLGDGRDPSCFYRTKKEIAITLESLLMNDDKGAESIFGLALGDAPDGTTGIIQPRDKLRSFTLETGFTDGASSHWYEVFTGCVINTLSLEASAGSPISITCDAFVKDVTRSGAEQTRTADNLSQITSSDMGYNLGPFTQDHATITINGSTPIVKTITVDINNNLNRIYALDGSLTIANSFATKRDVTGSFTIVKEDNVHRDIFTADPLSSSCTIELTLSKNSGAEYLRILLSDVRLLSRSFDRPGDDKPELEETFDFHAKTIVVDTKSA